MTDLPLKTDLTSGLTTEASFQSAIGDLYDVVKEMAIIGAPELHEIDTGAVTPTHAHIIVDTEDLDPTDNLDFIVPTVLGKKLLILRPTSAARVITVRHNQSGTGKIWLADAANAVLYTPAYTLVLYWSDTNSRWEELWRNFGLFITQAGEASAIRTALGLSGTYAPLNSPTFTGTVIVPTPTAGDNTTKAASTAFVKTALDNMQSSLTTQINNAVSAGVQAAGQNSQGYRTISSAAPSGGNNGDIWYRV